MPNYDLYCPACDVEFKAWGTIAQKSEGGLACPTCGSKNLETVFRAPPAVIARQKDQGCPAVGSCAGCQFAQGA